MPNWPLTAIRCHAGALWITRPKAMLRFFSYFPLKKSFSPCYWFSQCNLWQAFNQITRNSIERQTHYVRDSLHKTQYGSVNCSRLPDTSQRNFAIRSDSERSLVAHEILRVSCVIENSGEFRSSREQWRDIMTSVEWRMLSTHFASWNIVQPFDFLTSRLTKLPRHIHFQNHVK